MPTYLARPVWIVQYVLMFLAAALLWRKPPHGFRHCLVPMVFWTATVRVLSGSLWQNILYGVPPVAY